MSSSMRLTIVSLRTRYTRACSRPPMTSLMTPLLFDPGERWEYGTNIDWCGLIVEQIRGKRLGEVLQERVFAPLGMTDTGFALSPSMGARLAGIHARDADGSLTPMNFEITQEPEVQLGGGALYGTVGD